ncbi:MULTISPECIES: MBL fold metallo-hydrolase [Solibacillus]|uniref:MBL fold metallo-hydrolase n=1 Tax=Solibacillus TaxID=648800 RepID=UPI0007FB2DA2|nr:MULTISPECIES: MBL fold metallo-hydrolase [Solibacillus]OBW54685.1 hypothetical protein A9986_13750 [Solibacillus silvestris]
MNIKIKAIFLKLMMIVSMITVMLIAILISVFLKDKNKLGDYDKYFVSQYDKILSDEAVKVTSFGTTTLLLDDGETQILLDAFLTRQSLPRVLISKIETDETLVDDILEKEKINRLKAIFVSHSHYDHALDVAHIANRTNANIYGSESTLNIGRGGNVPEENLILFDINEPTEIGKFIVTVLPSIHSEPTVFNNDTGVVIEKPLKQPARMRDFKEGGSFDFLVQHGDNKMLVRPSFNYIEGALDNISADVLVLGINRLGMADLLKQDKFYEETVKNVNPNLIIPVHWDDFFSPLEKPLKAPIIFIDNLPAGLDYMIKRTTEDQITFKMLDAGQSTILFQEH